MILPNEIRVHTSIQITLMQIYLNGRLISNTETGILYVDAILENIYHTRFAPSLNMIMEWNIKMKNKQILANVQIENRVIFEKKYHIFFFYFFNTMIHIEKRVLLTQKLL